MLCYVSCPCPLFARNGVRLSKCMHIHFLLGSPVTTITTTTWSSWFWYHNISSYIFNLRTIFKPDLIVQTLNNEQ